MTHGWIRRVGGLLVLLAAVGCSEGSDAAVETTVPITTATTTVVPFTSDGSPTTTTMPTALIADGPLGEVCGESIVIQTSDLPAVGVGPLYALLGATPSIDVEAQSAAAPITRADGTVEDVILEIRSGGPSVDFHSPIMLMSEDDSIALAQVSTAVAVHDRSTVATHAVMTLTDTSADAVIIDPATYPDITDLAGVAASGIEVRHVTDAPVVDYLAASGILMADQLVAGSDGGPASFVSAGGAIAQQGALTVEPALFPALEQWARPVVAIPASDAGWLSLDDLIVVDAETQRIDDECLGRLVRVIQQAIVAYVSDSTPTNLVMGDIRNQFDPLNRISPALLDLGTQLAIDADVFDTTSDNPAGAIDAELLGPFLPELADVLDVESVDIDDLVDPRFIDPTISR